MSDHYVTLPPLLIPYTEEIQKHLSLLLENPSLLGPHGLCYYLSNAVVYTNPQLLNQDILAQKIYNWIGDNQKVVYPNNNSVYVPFPGVFTPERFNLTKILLTLL